MSEAADQIIGLYRRHASVWASNRASSPLFEARWLDRFLALQPRPATVLDIGCGSGEPIARYLIDDGHDVTGVDSSPELIAMCRSRFPDRRWRVADMRALGLGEQFSGLLAWDSFFHLRPDDQRAMFAVFRAHAGPRAALMFTSGPAHGEAIGRFAEEPLYHASLDAVEYRSLLREAGFDVIDHVVEDPACGGHTIWLAQLR